MVIEDDLCLKLSFQSFVGTGEWRNCKACLELGEEITDHGENSKGSKETSSKQEVQAAAHHQITPFICLAFKMHALQTLMQPAPSAARKKTAHSQNDSLGVCGIYK